MIAAFFGLLWLPTLDTFFHWDKAPEPNENRAPARFPQFESSLAGTRNFFSGLEAYYNDHFGFRKRLIRWGHKWKRYAFNDRSAHEVVIGRDGWLFFTSGKMIEHVRGTIPMLDDQRLNEWKSLLEGRRDWCQERGMRYAFVVCPDKHTVQTEFLPEWLAPIEKPSKFDQFLQFMKTNSTVQIIDLRGALKKAKAIQPTYLMTDTHWNDFGALVASRHIAESLSLVSPLQLENFEQQPGSNAGGDLAVMFGEGVTFPEKARFSFRPRSPLEALGQTVQTNYLGKSWIKHAEPLKTFNKNATGKAVVFQDSFGRGFVPFLGYHFQEVTFVWQYNWSKPLLENEKPDVVIDEMVERIFNLEQPKNLKAYDEADVIISSLGNRLETSTEANRLERLPAN